MRLEKPGLVAERNNQNFRLVVIDQHRARLPTNEQLCARFALTRREADVALLLVERRRNTEIASALSISAHTARHHTEHVLEKLAVSRRTEVEKILLGAHLALGGLCLFALIHAGIGLFRIGGISLVA